MHPLVLVDLKQVRDVRMPRFREQPGLLLKPVQGLLVGRDACIEPLDRDDRAVRAVFGPEDGAHAPLADFFQNAVPADAV